MKLILLAVAFLALAQYSFQLSCYNCKSPNYPSSLSQFNTGFPLCDKDEKNWPTVNPSDIHFEKCKKIVEKVKNDGKDDVLVIRTLGINDMNLNRSLFTEYTCSTDLCNSAVTKYATAFAVLFSIAATLATYI